MTQNEFLQDAIGMIDESLVQTALMTNPKPRRHFAFLIAAACLTVMLLAIPLGILIANRNETPNVPTITTNNTVITTAAPPVTTTPPQTTRPSVLDIPGATVFDENDERFDLSADRYNSGSISLTDEEILAWAKRVKEENKVVAGLVKSSTSVVVTEGDDLYRITYMEFTVLDDVSGVNQETVTVAYACRYELDGKQYRPATKYTVNCSTEETVKNSAVVNDMANVANYCMKDSMFGNALFLLKDAKDQTLPLTSGTVCFSDYADYVLDACFAYSPSSDIAVTTSLRTATGFRFKLNMLRSVIHHSLQLIPKKDGISFNFEDSFESFDNNPALSVTVDNECMFYNDIFIVKDNKPKLDQTYKWVVNIEGKRYEIERVWHFKYHLNTETTYREAPSVTLYFDLGSDFSWSDFAYNENREYTFQDISLELYNKDQNLICVTNLIDLWKCDGYTHTIPQPPATPPEITDPLGKGIDMLSGKKTPTQEPDPWGIAIKAIDNAFFRFENACAEFDGRAALVLSMNKESYITEDLFLDLNDLQINIAYVWEVIIEGVTYEIEGISFDNTSSELLVYLDLGHNFSWSRYPYNENGEYTFEEVTLGIYSSDYHYQPTYTYDYFAKLTDDALYGGYIHTKPN